MASAPPTLFDPAYRRAREDERFAMSADEYLAAHNVVDYVDDAIRLLAESGDSAPLDFLAAYFTNVLSGDNVIFRNFAYVQATPRNRRSFIRHVRDTFQRFDANEPTTVASLHQLLCLLCPDYPIDYVRCAYRIGAVRQRAPADDDDAQVPGALPFAHFSLHAFLFLYFAEFVRLAAEQFARVADDDRVDAAVNRGALLEAIVKELVSHRHGQMCAPPTSVLRDVLSRPARPGSPVDGTTTFDEFCADLFADATLPGALLEPRSYAELREGIDRLLESLSLNRSSGTMHRHSKKKGRAAKK
ncbi:Centriolar satellite-associated tubulin polyglutamylase complex regulator 1 [Plasmodiophora brassicae]